MTALAPLRAATIIRAIADAAQRWRNADFPPRVRATARVAERTGYSLPVVEYALDALFSFTADDLRAVAVNELGALTALDGFTAREGRTAAWAAPAGRVCVISSRTTIGVSLAPAIFALCAKCDVLVKDREDALIASFFETLVQEHDEFAAAARARAWDSNEGDSPDLHPFDTVVAFGSDQTLRAIAQRMKPGARFVGFGPRLSAGYVARESLSDERAAEELACGLARDLVLYESDGCLSLHVLFIEYGAAVSPARFCSMLARAADEANVEFPLGAHEPAVRARIAQVRDAAAFRAASGRGAAYAPAGGEHLLLLDPPFEDTPPLLPRTLPIFAIESPRQAVEYLEHHAIPLEAFALSSLRADVVDAAVDAGVSRITGIGELQRPTLSGNHGGRARIADFVRWIEKTH